MIPVREAVRREAARRYAACPACKAEAGRGCRTPKGALTAEHAARLTLADTAASAAAKCPAKSPESHTPCSLPDLAAFHRFGHESLPDYPSRSTAPAVAWATTDADHSRWRKHP